MTWIVAGVAWIIIASAFGMALGRIAAPRTEVERRADDEEQIEWLRQHQRRNATTGGLYAARDRAIGEFEPSET